jgi:hypothetical protein
MLDHGDTCGSRMKFVSGTARECARPRAQQREMADRCQEISSAEDDSNLAAAGDGRTPGGISLVRIIGARPVEQTELGV